MYLKYKKKKKKTIKMSLQVKKDKIYRKLMKITNKIKNRI